MKVILFSILLSAVSCYSPFAQIQQPLAAKAVSSFPTCPNAPLSCQNTTEITDSCCYDDSLFLSTQFWNYYPAIGPNDTFTLHGLWPDKCDGTYEQFCDSSMNVNNITAILEKAGEHALLKRMKEIWLNINHNDESLWLHEWNKHATCINTIKRGCYDEFKEHQNVLEFCHVTVNLFEKLPTFDWLAEAGIHPSVDASYTKKQVTDALSGKFGAVPFIKCNKFNAIQEVWYFHSSKGSLRSGNFVPIPSIMDGNCPENGVKFYPKGSFGGQPPSKRPLSGFVKLSAQEGCLIRNGRWFIGGSCAQYQLLKAEFGGYNLKTRAGFCSLDKDGALSCGRKARPVQFQYDKESGVLSLNGLTTWSAVTKPRKYQHVGVYPGSGKGIDFQLTFEARGF